MCTCGACRAPLNDCQMRPACHGYHEQNAKIDADIAKGMSRDEILAEFVKEHGGQDILTAPIDRGFNRLAWLLPYVVGASGASILGFAAWRWSKKDDPPSGTPESMPSDDALAERLEDELRDLD